MTNAEHEDLVNAGRGHLSRYAVRPDADDIIEESKRFLRGIPTAACVAAILAKNERTTER